MMLKSVLKIDLPLWVCREELQKLFSYIAGSSDDPQSLLVGGCVRNAVLGLHETDVDIATKYKPEEITEILESKNIKVVPTGIAHGTVTAVLNGQPFEITTLRRDDVTDGRHAKVSFTDDWVEDAKRRDFTMNALLADLSGNIFDLLGNGIKDLESRNVIFVGDPEKRIEEDYLRILRFFRFYAQYGEGEPDSTAIKACKKLTDNIQTLSRERITSEFFKILETQRAAKVLALMNDAKILQEVISATDRLQMLERLIELQEKYECPEVVSRLFIVSDCKARFYDDLLRLSHAQKNFLIKLEMVIREEFYQNEKELKKAIFYHGNDLLVQGYLLKVACQDMKESSEMFKIAKDWQAPDCPITGETLLAEGYQTGPELGQELSRRQEEWIDNDFSLHNQ